MSWSNPKKPKSPVPETAPLKKVVCPICRQKVYANRRGEILAHTGVSLYKSADACAGGVKGAKP